MLVEIRPGDRVLVRWAGLPKTSPCHRHLQSELPLFQSVGVVDRIDERYGQHCLIVLFLTIRTEPFGTAWVDAFRADELVRVEPEYAF